MNLRVRLIVAFFLLSVVPLGAVTFYAYTSTASAMRDAAGREAELLADDLTERMKLVTVQLSQQFERLMDIPASTQLAETPPASAAEQATADARANASAPVSPSPSATDTPTAKQAARVAGQLGEVAMLLNNIEVRDFGFGRRGFGGLRGAPGNGQPFAPRSGQRFSGNGQRGLGADGQPGDTVGEQPPAGSDSPRSRGAFGPPPAPPAIDATMPRPPTAPPSSTSGPTDGSGRRGRAGPPPDGNDGQVSPGGERGAAGSPRLGGPPPEEPADPTRIQIDLGPMRREILRQIFPDRERWDQLSQQERELILTKVNERMLGIQQGIQILQQKATEQADRLRATDTAAQTAQGTAVGLAASERQPGETADAKPAVPATPPARTPQAEGKPRRQDGPGTERGQSAPGVRTRQTALSGSRIDVRVMQGGQLVGQVNAEINLPNLLATVFTTTRRDQGEVPFAVDKNGRLYTPTDADRARLSLLKTTAVRPDTPVGTELLSDWVIVTTMDPTGSGLKFGIARPIGGALDELRRSSARNAGLGLGLICLALIGIVPLSSRLTRNLWRLSNGVHRIAQGDYQARVDVTSKDEIGQLAGAFNRMAADVERHQRSAVEQERLRRELELGRQIQHDMLPNAPLRLGLTEIRGVSVPAREVGGDFYNYFQTPQQKVALVMGDVSGKGVGAALLMANIQASIRTRLALGQDLTSLVRELDNEIAASTPEAVYATLFVALLDLETRTLEYVNAGHNPQYILRSNRTLEAMESAGLPVGLLPGRGYAEHRVDLSPDDVLFFYTDGCVEAENAAGETFGNARLESLLTTGPVAKTDDLLARIEEAIVAFRSGREAFDDATMMVVHVG